VFMCECATLSCVRVYACGCAYVCFLFICICVRVYELRARKSSSLRMFVVRVRRVCVYD